MGTHSLTLSVTVKNTDTECSKPVTSSATVSVAWSNCCSMEGTAYAYGAGDNSKAYCFRSNETLNGVTMQNRCNNSNWGWTNQLKGADSLGTLYPIYTGVGRDTCDFTKSGALVGQIKVACTDTGGAEPTDANVKFGPLHDVYGIRPQPINGALELHYYLGCNVSTACTPPNYMANIPTSTLKIGKKTIISSTGTERPAYTQCVQNGGPYLSCAGALPDGIDINSPTGEGVLELNFKCGCGSIFWILHESAKYYTPLPVCP